MKDSKNLKDFFVKIHSKIMQLLKLYLNDPTREENIHDLRICIRRIEAAYFILPNYCKTKKSEKYVRQLKKFFSLSSKIRDYDVILAKLNEFAYNQESKLMLTLMRNKLKQISKSIKIAENLSQLKELKIKFSKKSDGKFEKKTLFLIKKFRKHIPIVMKDESKVEELHSMRKTVKKMRYILELKEEEKNQESFKDIISHMKQLQKILGEIHDIDIFISYLRRKETTIKDLSEIITSEKTKRNVKYSVLVSALSKFK